MSQPAANAEPQMLTVMQVAARLKLRYQKARDKMLAGQMGAPEYKGNKLRVPLAGVVAYEQTRATRQGAKA